MRRAGLTLIEVLAALAVMAAIALMSRSVLDTMVRSLALVAERSSQLGSLQMGLSQWTRDLDHLSATPYVNALQWDGKMLRLVRRSSSEDALWVVTWTLHGGAWRRWQSAPLRDRQALVQAWQESAGAMGAGSSGTSGTRVDLVPLANWNVQFWNDGRWTDASVATTTTGEAASRLVQTPQAIRLQLRFADGSSPSTSLELDWMDRSQP